ncbi:MAG: tetratricopeptide repeat protein [Deltaproteobacteria bacterium]|nr:MAG: tetratricopeptide repeat protein [Deltaproteobacteria bacterium]
MCRLPSAVPVARLPPAARRLPRRPSAARRLHERSLAIREGSLGPEHPRVSYPLVGLAKVALAQRRTNEAVRHAERAAALREGARWRPRRSRRHDSCSLVPFGPLAETGDGPSNSPARRGMPTGKRARPRSRNSPRWRLGSRSGGTGLDGGEGRDARRTRPI